jgi:dihydrofolate reductase
VPVFVLTHYARSPIVMEGGTTFYFVTDGVESALRQAREAAQGRDVRIGGGVSTIQQYLRARLIDEMHFAVAPMFLGGGEALFGGLDMRTLGYACTERVLTPNAIHLIAKRQDQ